jgi:tRNA (cmo5U34)-methyltransferase
MKDTIFSKPFTKVSDFVFDNKVAAVFEDMANRSIPGYGVVISMIGVITREYAKNNTNLYDLGSSLGAVSLSMSQNLNKKKCTIKAIDNSAAMIEKSKRLIAKEKNTANIDLLCADIREAPIENASLVTLNFTLQFLNEEERLPLLKKIYKGLLPGAALILSEKLFFEAADENNIQQRLYEAFKKAHGYSELEISQKRTALENVMRTDSLNVHMERLKQAGFKTAYLWFQSFHFVSILAEK